jgi:CBS domain-containing protein
MKTVADVMTREVHSVPPDMRIADLERALLKERVSGFPVVDGERLIGVVSRSDIVRQLSVEQSQAEAFSGFYNDTNGASGGTLKEIGQFVGRRIEGMTVSDVMVRGLVTISADTTIVAAAALMLERRIHRLPVVTDEKLVGLVTSMDFVKLVAAGRLADD